jgi:pyridoxine 4-dehydrogenase
MWTYFCGKIYTFFILNNIPMNNTTIEIEKTFSIGNDLKVNRLGYGAMRITGKGIWGQPENKAEAIKVLQQAVKLGVNFIDTADSYGPHISEELIAEALFPYPKDLVIATKGGLTRSGPNQWSQDGSAAHLKQALAGSLKRLKLNTIDLYQLHRIDAKVRTEETFEFLQQAQKEGKIKHIGLSEVSVDDIKKAGEYFKVVSVQNMYSVDNRKWEAVLQYCTEHDIAFIPWYPLNANNIAAIGVLQKTADKHKATVQQVALSWLLQHANNILPIPGTSSVDHLKENMETWSVTLTDDDVKALNTISA